MHFARVSVLFLFFLSPLATRADLTIVQKVDGAQGSNQVTLKVKGNKARVEINPQITTILDAQTGDLTTLLNDQKKVMRISGEKAKAMAEMAKAMSKEMLPSDAPPKATGQKQKINGYETEEYVTEAPKFRTSYWVAKDYPDYQAIVKQMAVLQNGAFAALRKGLPDFKDLPGLPLRTEVKADGKNQMTSTIESVTTTPLPDADFTIPAGYSEMKMPDFLGGKKAPGQSGDE